MNSKARRALYDNLGQNETLASRIDHIVRTTKKADWRGHTVKEREVRNAIREELATYTTDADPTTIFDLIKNQPEY